MQILRSHLASGLIKPNASPPQGRKSDGLDLAGCDHLPVFFNQLWQQFMDFAYRGGWLTPFVEAVGLHRTGFLTRRMMDNEGLRSRISQAARLEVEGRSWQQSTGRVRQVYAEAIRETERPNGHSPWRQRLAKLTTLTLVNVFRSLAGRERKANKQLAL